MNIPIKATVVLYPYTDLKTNQVVYPEPVELDNPLVSFEDISQRKIILAKLDKFPYPVVLYTSEEYTQLGDSWTKQDLANRLLAKLGDNPSTVLQSIVPLTLEKDPHGPGTILSGMISSLGIHSSPTCSCKQRALRMNIMGPDWCEEHLEEILGWLEEESKKRKLPFIKTIASLMVKRAISKSRRLLSKTTNVSTT